MKKYFFAAALLVATITANATSSVGDTLVIDNSADQKLIEQFIETDKAFEARSSKSATYQDRRITYVGNNPNPVTLEKRDQRGLSLGLAGGIMGTGQDDWGPKFGVSLNYEGNKNLLSFSAEWLTVKPHENSDYKNKVRGMGFNMAYGRTLGSWNDHHLRLTAYVAATFKTAFDKQNFGEYQTVSQQETETEIVTTTETGRMSYQVKPYMVGVEFGLELSYQFYNSPIGLYMRAGDGATTLIDGKENVNGSADGISIKNQFRAEIGIRFYLHGKTKNMKARNMIRH